MVLQLAVIDFLQQRKKVIFLRRVAGKGERGKRYMGDIFTSDQSSGFFQQGSEMEGIFPGKEGNVKGSGGFSRECVFRQVAPLDIVAGEEQVAHQGDGHGFVP